MSYCHKDIITEIKKDTKEVYANEICIKEDATLKGQKMLVITPDLSLTGANVVLLELLMLLQTKGYDLYVLSTADGVFKEKFLGLGAIVFIRPYVSCSDSFRKFLQEAFDIVLINSAACFYYSYYFINTKVKVVWWFHETKSQLDTMRGGFLNLSLLGENFTLAGVTKSVKDGIFNDYNIEIPLLPMPVKDRLSEYGHKRTDKVTFFMPAAYTYIKGQDILFKAVSMLPAKYMKKAHFIMCGYQLEGQREYYSNMKAIASKIPCVTFFDEISRDEVYEYYSKCDCVLAPSRVDATPTTIVEAMMFEKICLVSDAAGISKYLEDCKSAFIFPSENAVELYKRILFIIEALDELSNIAKVGREVYIREFSTESVLKKWDEIMN